MVKIQKTPTPDQPESGPGRHRGAPDSGDTSTATPGRHRRKVPAEAEGALEIIADRRGGVSRRGLRATGAE